MKNKFKKILVAILVFLCLPVKIAAAGDSDATVSEIFEYEFNKAGVQDASEYLAAGLLPLAGNGGEWLTIYLHEAGYAADYDEYAKALTVCLNENDELKITDRERIGLCLSAIGGYEDYVTAILDDNGNCEEIMEMIYLLILGNSRDYGRDELLSSVAQRLMNLRLADGGWALVGEVSDVDVTAMALQALAPYRETYEAEITEALDRLSSLQMESGAFISYGKENSESTAQVILALCALDLDYEFSVDPVDALDAFALGDGSYEHIKGAGSNELATTQALSAYLCEHLYEESGRFLYDFTESVDNSPTNAHVTDNVKASGKTRSLTGSQIKIILLSAIALIYLAFVLIMLARKKITLPKIVLATVLLIGLTIAVILVKIESVSEHYDVSDGGDVSTTICIIGHDETILSRTEIRIDEGDTAFDQLCNATGQAHINIDYSGSENLGTIYVKAIDGLAEFDYGSMSGWTYSVNGTSPKVSCCETVLKEGDYVEWVYVE